MVNPSALAGNGLSAVGLARPSTVNHPLGPRLYLVAIRNPVRGRLLAALVFGCAAGVLGIAMWLRPDQSGLGTHQQLGRPPCSLVVMTGYPCPTCGMTTSVSHAVRGELLSSFHAQPAGLVFAAACVLAVALSLGVLVTGNVWVVNWYRVSPARVVLFVVLLLLGGWAYNVVAGLLTGSLSIWR